MKKIAFTVSLLSLVSAGAALAQGETAASTAETVARTLVPLENPAATQAAAVTGETLGEIGADVGVSPQAAPPTPLGAVAAQPVSPMIRHQLQVSDDMMRLQREQERMTAAKELADMVGLENVGRLVPGLGIDLENSPLGLQSQIDQMNLINELTQALVENRRIIQEGAGVVTPVEAVPAGPDEGQLAVNGDNLRPVTMGELQDLLAQRDSAPPIPMATEMVAPVGTLEVPQEAAPLQVQVIQVYGSNDDYTAIVLLNGQEAKLRAGDNLPDGRSVSAIARDSVTLASAEGEEQVLNLR